MKRLLNLSLQEENMIDIEESSNKEDTQSKRIKGMISQSLESIKENIKTIPKLPMRKFVDKGKEVIS